MAIFLGSKIGCTVLSPSLSHQNSFPSFLMGKKPTYLPREITPPEDCLRNHLFNPRENPNFHGLHDHSPLCTDRGGPVCRLQCRSIHRHDLGPTERPTIAPVPGRGSLVAEWHRTPKNLLHSGRHPAGIRRKQH